jgi:hypothetical protein
VLPFSRLSGSSGRLPFGRLRIALAARSGRAGRKGPRHEAGSSSLRKPRGLSRGLHPLEYLKHGVNSVGMAFEENGK